MTDDQHRAVGRILGYPECCVEAWVAGPLNAAQARGAVTERLRSREEAAELDREVTALLGRPFRGCSAHPHKRYVPCPSCAS